ncbi:MAG: hypothetical protein Q9M91_02035 [Candidatus Dojkabacteria bacterium]|nr:hypothetical protein [Candidatus Dojkabacteria bacterium]MDQ7020603.1 hypothetical protein [Candidatus Dojkabacteria bacterium]
MFDKDKDEDWGENSAPESFENKEEYDEFEDRFHDSKFREMLSKLSQNAYKNYLNERMIEDFELEIVCQLEQLVDEFINFSPSLSYDHINKFFTYQKLNTSDHGVAYIYDALFYILDDLCKKQTWKDKF